MSDFKGEGSILRSFQMSRDAIEQVVRKYASEQESSELQRWAEKFFKKPVDAVRESIEKSRKSLWHANIPHEPGVLTAMVVSDINSAATFQTEYGDEDFEYLPSKLFPDKHLLKWNWNLLARILMKSGIDIEDLIAYVESPLIEKIEFDQPNLTADVMAPEDSFPELLDSALKAIKKVFESNE